MKIPEGLWVKCDNCKEIIYRKEVDKNFKVCPKCDYHFRISASERLPYLVDEGSFLEVEDGLSPRDFLTFKDYKDKLKTSRKKTGLKDAVISGEAKIGGKHVSIVVMDFDFMGGSMGSVVGEKITRAIERAIEKRMPFVSVASSGGARMQEGILSLMQMAKTSAAVARLGEAGLPFISVLTDPTFGGVTASFAMLGDIIIAEPKSLIGFAGPRVIEQTIKQQLPPGFQRAEFLLEHGMIDMIVPRKDMRAILGKMLDFFAEQGRCMGELAKILILLGAVLIVVGLVMLGHPETPLCRESFREISSSSGRTSHSYFPLATSIIVSILISLDPVSHQQVQVACSSDSLHRPLHRSMTQDAMNDDQVLKRSALLIATLAVFPHALHGLLHQYRAPRHRQGVPDERGAHELGPDVIPAVRGHVPRSLRQAGGHLRTEADLRLRHLDLYALIARCSRCRRPPRCSSRSACSRGSAAP